jgi:outer membrane biosynthesis protein TonB
MNKLFAIALCGAVGLIASLPSAQAQQKTEKACQEEWRANKAENQAAKITEKAYVAKCRGTAAKPEAAKPDAAKKPAAAPTKPEAPAATAPRPTPAQAPAPAATKSESAKPATAMPTGKNQFTTEAQAKGRCPTDTVVYVNLSSKIYHFAGHKDYGNLKNGTYMCEKDTAGAGARAAKNEKHP